MDFLERKRERRMRDLSYRIAYFWEDYDPYGFLDSLETGESKESGIQRLADYALSEMMTGHFNQLIHDIYDGDLDGQPALRTEMESIVSTLRILQEQYQNEIRKNSLPYKRRN